MELSQTRNQLPGDAPAEGLDERRPRPGLVAGAAAATALVIVVLNNLGAGAGTQGIPVPERTGVPFPTQTSGVMVRVPSLVGEQESSASRLLVDRQLAPIAVHRFVACHPAGVVVEQEPPPGVRVPAGEAVDLVVADTASEQLTCPDGVALDQDRTLVGLIDEFGRGVADARPPTARTLSLGMLGDDPAVSLTGRDAQDVDRWRVVPPYGDATDAVPVLAGLVVSGGRYRVDLGPHPRCVGPVRPPAPAFAGLRQLAVTPTAARDSCLDWWAVDLFVDDTGRIRGVNLDVWEP